MKRCRRPTTASKPAPLVRNTRALAPPLATASDRCRCQAGKYPPKRQGTQARLHNLNSSQVPAHHSESPELRHDHQTERPSLRRASRRPRPSQQRAPYTAPNPCARCRANQAPRCAPTQQSRPATRPHLAQVPRATLRNGRPIHVSTRTRPANRFDHPEHRTRRAKSYAPVDQPGVAALPESPAARAHRWTQACEGRRPTPATQRDPASRAPTPSRTTRLANPTSHNTRKRPARTQRCAGAHRQTKDSKD